MTKSTLAAALLLAVFLGADDLKERLASKDPLVRIAAAKDAAKSPSDGAAKLLAKALADDDHEVALEAALALGAIGDPSANKALMDLGLEGPVAHVRRAACEALAKLAPADAAEKFAKSARGKSELRALEALAYLGEAVAVLGGEVAFEVEDLAERALSSDPWVAWFAGRAAVFGGRGVQPLAELAALTKRENRGFTALCGALEAAAVRPNDGIVTVVQGMLLETGLDDLVERRALRVLANAVDLGAGEAAANEVVSGLALDRQARVAKLVIDRLDAASDDSGANADAHAAVRGAALAWARAALGGADAATRGAGLDVLERESLDDDLAAVLRLFEGDDRRTRQRAARALSRGWPVAKWIESATAQFGKEDHFVLREEIAVQIGVRGAAEALPLLRTALADKNWEVVVCAAVSVGKTNVDGAAELLAELTDDSDWRKRGAAAAGFGWLYRADSIEPLVSLLKDRDTSVSRTALESLRRLTDRGDLGPDPDAWLAWWNEAKVRHRFEHPADREESRKKYGYSDLERPPDASVYRELYDAFDVIALSGQADFVEKLLDGMKIPYRMTSASKLPESEVHPFAAFFANCTGDVNGDDVERLQWFIRTGGHLFASCWSLEGTIAKVYPGVIRQVGIDTQEVIGSVPIFPADPSSRFLPGVFPRTVTPYFHLEGSMLIHVERPELGEVLIDSPIARDLWGHGNLVAWFEAGHGMLLDSANHFQIHGFDRLEDLGDAESLQAYALDHMGLPLDRWRAIEGEKFWKKKSDAAANVPETAVFNFVTNFIRRYRAGLPR
jgi:HEAT repeat protein